jgi:hypothetical protein
MMAKRFSNDEVLERLAEIVPYLYRQAHCQRLRIHRDGIRNVRPRRLMRQFNQVAAAIEQAIEMLENE